MWLVLSPVYAASAATYAEQSVASSGAENKKEQVSKQHK